MACLYQGRYTEALAYLEASLALWRKLKHKQSELETLADLVEYELVTGNRQRASDRLTELESLVEQSGEFDHLLPTLEKHRQSLTAA
jgi:hypothetical protein